MLLPFVRELFAGVENSESFRRAAGLLKSGRGEGRAGAGRIRVSGLIPSAKARYLPLLQHAAGRPIIVLVRDNRAAEELLPVVRAFSELTGAVVPSAVINLPAHDVLPFENLSPHPEIQEQRATALWKISAGGASIIIAPMASAAMRLRPANYYADLGRVLRRGEDIDVESLVAHLNVVGYTPGDVVEMPGEYALRGGILDVYSPESDRPVRVEFFGDEIDSIRSFDPASQRSPSPREEVVLLPLAETPVSTEILAGIHARLSGSRVAGSHEVVERAVAAGGVSVFPGWEFYAGVASAEGKLSSGTLFELLPDSVVL